MTGLFLYLDIFFRTWATILQQISNYTPADATSKETCHSNAQPEHHAGKIYIQNNSFSFDVCQRLCGSLSSPSPVPLMPPLSSRTILFVRCRLATEVQRFRSLSSWHKQIRRDKRGMSMKSRKNQGKQWEDGRQGDLIVIKACAPSVSPRWWARLMFPVLTYIHPIAQR